VTSGDGAKGSRDTRVDEFASLESSGKDKADLETKEFSAIPFFPADFLLLFTCTELGFWDSSPSFKTEDD